MAVFMGCPDVLATFSDGEEESQDNGKQTSLHKNWTCSSIGKKKKELKQLIYKDLIPWKSSMFIILSLFLSDICGHWSLNHVISVFLSSTAQHREMPIESRIESLIQLIFWHQLPRFKFEFWSAHMFPRGGDSVLRLLRNTCKQRLETKTF